VIVLKTSRSFVFRGNCCSSTEAGRHTLVTPQPDCARYHGPYLTRTLWHIACSPTHPPLLLGQSRTRISREVQTMITVVAWPINRNRKFSRLPHTIRRRHLHRCLCRTLIA